MAAEKPVLVLASNGMKAALLDLRPQLEQAMGRTLVLQFSSTAALKKRIQAGEPFDATIIASEAVRDLAKQGKVAGNTHTEVGYSRLGVGARTGLRKPDLQTPESFKQALLNAKSITYPSDGASRAYLDSMFEQLDITEAMKAKVYLAEGTAASTASVAQGRSDLVLTLFSEIIPVQGLVVLGPLPGGLGFEINFAAATSSSSQSAEASKLMIAFLAGPKATPVFKESGIERR